MRLQNQKKSTLKTTSQRKRPRKLPKSGFRGVYWHERTKKWMATIKIDGHVKYLGLCEDPIKAAILYDEMASELKRKKETLNFKGVRPDEKAEREKRQALALPRGFGQGK